MLFKDASRHKADAIANASQAVVLDKATGQWAIKERWEVAVGDFVKVSEKQRYLVVFAHIHRADQIRSDQTGHHTLYTSQHIIADRRTDHVRSSPVHDVRSRSSERGDIRLGRSDQIRSSVFNDLRRGYLGTDQEQIIRI